MVAMALRSRRGNSIRPVHRIKHVIDKQLGLVLNVAQDFNLALSKDAPVVANTEEVESGSTINGIYLNVEAYATTAGALANIYMYVAKNPGNAITLPAANLVGNQSTKKYIIHQEMKMLEQSVNGNPRTIFNGVIVLPRGYRRQAISDLLVLRLFSPGVNCSVCFQCHYKEFR